MSLVHDESPADEYERELDERREDIRAALAGVIAFSSWLHAFGLIAAVIAAFGRQRNAWVVVLVLWTAAVLLAILSASVCLRNLRDLTGRLALLGLLPWFVLVAELTGLILLVALGWAQL